MALIPYQNLPGDKDPPLLADGQPVEEFYCGDPRCDCVTGHLWLRGVGMAVDVGTGRLDFLDGLRTQDRERLRAALGQVIRTGDTLDWLRAHYRAVQEYGWEHHYEHLDWTQLRQGEFVTYHEVFLREKVPLLPIYAPRERAAPDKDKAEGGAVEAEAEGETEKEERLVYHLGLSDAYCVDARCDCRRVIWTVSATLPGDGTQVRRLGVVSFDFRKHEPQVMQVAAGIDPDHLLVMVIRQLHRYPGLVDEHEVRYGHLRQIMLPLIARQRRDKEAQTRSPLKDVGRNDPCPCGSGKKFKRCHGQAPAPRPS